MHISSKMYKIINSLNDITHNSLEKIWEKDLKENIDPDI